MLQRGMVIKAGGVLLLPSVVYWVYATPFRLISRVPWEAWLVILSTAAVALALLIVAVLCVLRRTSGAVAGAVLGHATAAECVVMLVMTTHRERRQIADFGGGGIVSSWWLLVIAVCGVLAGVLLLGAPVLRADSVPLGGPKGRESWRWAAVVVGVLQVASVVALLRLTYTLPERLQDSPGKPGLIVLGLLWLGSAVVAAVLRGLSGVVVPAGLALAALVLQIVFGVQEGASIVGSFWAWLGALLLADAAVVCWVLPLLRGWTPRVRREMATRPGGLFD